jgi:hypothetical protein
VDVEGGAPRSSNLLRSLFYLIAALLLGALGYTGWVVATYWGRVGV